MTDFKYNVDSSEELKQGAFDFKIKDEYHYIKIGATNVGQLKKSKIIPNKKYTGLEKNKPDGLIIHGKNDVRVLVEYKKSGIFQSKEEARNIISEWYFKLAKQLNCNVICASDGTNTYWFYTATREIIKNKDNSELSLKLDVSKITNNELTNEEKNDLSVILKKFNQLDNEGRLQEEIILNPQDLARRVWQKIWINTGKEPEKCLYNVVEIFIFKFLSDLKILEKSLSFNHVLSLKEESNDRALECYANEVRGKIRKMFPKGGDGTTIINGTIFVNEEGNPNHKNAKLFVEVLEEFKKFEKENGTFDNIDKNFKTRLYENFLRQSAGIRSLGQYFTPRNVVKSIIGMTNVDTVNESAKICDPFCGVGGFLLELLNEAPKLKKQFEPVNGVINPKLEIIGYDKGSDEKEDERTIILAKANMLIYFSDYISKHKNSMKEFAEQVFNKTFHLEKTNVGTLGIKKHENYFDLIITNPPYVTSGVTSIKNDLDMDNMYPSNGNGLEGLAIEWIIRALKPNGRAFIVVPDGVLSRQNDRRLRDKIIKTCEINAIVSLPSRTFFATPKKTFILAITKKSENKTQDKPFFTYLVTDIGETKDAKRFEIKENDLNDMSTLYRQFVATPNDFKTDNPRCKIQPINRLKNNHWLVDKDWNDEEKKELGLQEEITELSEDEFDKRIKEIGNFILGFEKVKIEEDKDTQYREVDIFDKNYFELKRGKRITHKEIHENIGNIPVYSSSKFNKPMGYIKEKFLIENNLIICEEKAISFNIDGSVGKCFIRDGKYSFIDVVALLKIRKEDILIDYIYHIFQEQLNLTGATYSDKLYFEKLKDYNILIPIPIKADGSFDLEKQKEIAKRYERIEYKKTKMMEYLKEILDIQVRIEM